MTRENLLHLTAGDLVHGLLAILAPRWRHGNLARLAIMVVALLMVGVTVPLACMKATTADTKPAMKPAPANVKSGEKPGEWQEHIRATLPKGWSLKTAKNGSFMIERDEPIRILHNSPIASAPNEQTLRIRVTAGPTVAQEKYAEMVAYNEALGRRFAGNDATLALTAPWPWWQERTALSVNQPWLLPTHFGNGVSLRIECLPFHGNTARTPDDGQYQYQVAADAQEAARVFAAVTKNFMTYAAPANVQSGEKPAVKIIEPDKAKLTPEQAVKRDELLAAAGEKIQIGFKELAKTYPELAGARIYTDFQPDKLQFDATNFVAPYWKTEPSKDAPKPPVDFYEVTIIILTLEQERKAPLQMAMLDSTFWSLGMLSYRNIHAANAKLQAELDKLVADALSPLKALAAQVSQAQKEGESKPAAPVKPENVKSGEKAGEYHETDWGRVVKHTDGQLTVFNGRGGPPYPKEFQPKLEPFLGHFVKVDLTRSFSRRGGPMKPSEEMIPDIIRIDKVTSLADGPKQLPVTITLETSRPEYRPGEPIRLTVHIRNTTAEPTTLQLLVAGASLCQDYHEVCRLEPENLYNQPHPYGPDLSRAQTLGPSQELSFSFSSTRMAPPGTYQLVFEAPARLQCWEMSSQSELAKLTILAPANAAERVAALKFWLLQADLSDRPRMAEELLKESDESGVVEVLRLIESGAYAPQESYHNYGSACALAWRHGGVRGRELLVKLIHRQTRQDVVQRMLPQTPISADEAKALDQLLTDTQPTWRDISGWVDQPRVGDIVASWLSGYTDGKIIFPQNGTEAERNKAVSTVRTQFRENPGLFSLIQQQAVTLSRPMTGANPENVKSGEKAALPGIPDVDSLAALEKVEAIHVGTDWKVRLGLGEAGRDAGPWKLLYCLAEYVGTNSATKLSFKGYTDYGSLLGPLSFNLSPVGLEEAQEACLSSYQVPRRGLFLNSVLLADKGVFDLQVRAIDGTLVAARRLVVKEAAPCQWQRFGETAGQDLNHEPYEVWLGLGDRAALPTFDGLASLLPENGEVEGLAGEPLPGQLPGRSALDQMLCDRPAEKPLLKKGEEVNGLKLTLDGDLLTIRAEAKMIDWPDLNLLVRWRLNGKAVEPERATEYQMRDLSRLQGRKDTMQVRLWLARGKIKVGDKISLQVLYTPGMWEPFMVAGKGARTLCAGNPGAGAKIPMTSNWLEIEVTDKLLANPDEAKSEKPAAPAAPENVKSGEKAAGAATGLEVTIPPLPEQAGEPQEPPADTPHGAVVDGLSLGVWSEKKSYELNTRMNVWLLLSNTNKDAEGQPKPYDPAIHKDDFLIITDADGQQMKIKGQHPVDGPKGVGFKGGISLTLHKHIRKPGVYKLQWKIGKLESNVIELRVVALQPAALPAPGNVKSGEKAAATEKLLPGSGLNELPAHVWGTEVLALMEATEEPRPETLAGTQRLVAGQEFKVVEFSGDSKSEKLARVTYRYDSATEAPIAKGRRVIWRTLNGVDFGGVIGGGPCVVQWGVKAYADTPANREAALAGRALPAAPTAADPVVKQPEQKVFLFPGSFVPLVKALEAKGKVVVLCQALDEGRNVGVNTEPGEDFVDQKYKVVQVFAGESVAKELNIHYSRMTFPYPEERQIVKGDQVIWIVTPKDKANRWEGLKALADTPENRQALGVDAAPANVKSGEKAAGAKTTATAAQPGPSEKPELPPFFMGESLPAPPAQSKPWTPPETKLPKVAVIAATTLFEQGLADPRDCEYREVEVAVGNCWNGGGQAEKVHAWVLPAAKDQKQRFAVCWNGLVYPVLTVGSAADLKADVQAAVKAGQVANTLLTNERDWVSHQHLQSLAVCLLLRLGEKELAESVWGASGGRKHGDDFQHDPYLALAEDWAWAMFDRAVCAHMRGDDHLALLTVRTLEKARPAIEKSAREDKFSDLPKDDINSRIGQIYLVFLKDTDGLLADQERRAKERKVAVVSAKPAKPAASPTAAERIKDEIRQLEDAAARQDGQPGAVDLTEDPRVQALIHEGDAAVEPLLDCLEQDQRLTRSVEFHRDFKRGRHVIPVSQAEFVALLNILQTSSFKMPPGSGDDRKAIIAAIRIYWKEYGKVPMEERWYKALAEDGGTIGQWVEAAANIVCPTNVNQHLGTAFSITETTVTKGDPAPKMRGEALRTKTNPNVSELMAKRVAMMVKASAISDANSMAMALYAWETKAAGPSLRLVFDSLRQPNGQTWPYAFLAICGETDALVDCGDKAALADYAAWLLRQKAEDFSFGGDGIFGPLCRHAGDPAVAAAAETIFNGPESPWNPVLGKSRSSVHNLGPLIVLEAVRKQALRELKDKTVIGKTVAEGTSGHVEVPGTGLSLDAPPEDPLHPVAGTTLPLRQCDFYAWQLSCMPGFPECEPYWPEAKRDEAIAACAAYLQKYGSHYQPAAPDPMLGFRGGAQLVLPPLDHPATARDVAEGRAIFSLEGQGETRLVKTVHLPQNAQWKTYKGAGLTGGRVTNPKTGKEEMTVRYIQDGTVWQAEEVLKDGQWQRYYGFVGRYCLAQVPAAELEFANENGSPVAK